MPAPTVSPCETRRPEFPATVHAYTDVLRELVDGPHSAEALAQATDRVPSNVRRDAQKLRAAGVIEMVGAGETVKWRLTDKGRRWVTGIDVAEGRAAPVSNLALSDAERRALHSGVIIPSALGSRPSPPTIWPIDNFRANPANRKLTAGDIDSMADSIAAQGILQPLTASPADADGFRTIWIGHRRWRGAERARDEGRLHPSLAEGLPFVEREATPAEALAMTLVENVERQSIPPLELAFLLRDYADAAGEGDRPLDAKSVAERLGLVSPSGGYRDVQVKIQIARKAAPEALAAYAQDGSWDRLYESVREKKAAGPEIEESAHAEPPIHWTTHDVHRTPFADRAGDTEKMLTIWVMFDGGERFTIDWIANVDGERVKHSGGEILPNADLALTRAIAAIRDRFKGRLPRGAIEWLDQLQGPFFVEGVNCFNASNAGERRRAIGWDPRLSNSGGGSSDPRPSTLDPDAALPLDEPEPSALSPRARLALIEIAHKTAEHPRPIVPASGAEWTGDPALDFAAFGAAAGKFWLDAAFNELQASRFARAMMQTDQPPIVALTPDGVAWFRGSGVELPVSETALASAQAGAGGLQPMGTYASEWLRVEAAPPPSAGTGDLDRHPGEGRDHPDLYDRTPDQIAADAALLDRARAFADQDQPTGPGDDFRTVWTALGLDPEVVISQSVGGVLANPSDGAEPLEILTADSGGALPDERAHAIAWLTGWAIEQALNAGAGQ